MPETRIQSQSTACCGLPEIRQDLPPPEPCQMISGTIINATTLMIVMSGSSAGSAVSL